MSRRHQWDLLANRADGVLRAASMYAGPAVYVDDMHGVGWSRISEPAKQLVEDIREFALRNEATLPPDAVAFLKKLTNDFGPSTGLAGVMHTTAVLARIRSEFEYLVGCDLIEVQALTERAFEHLNRQIVVNGRVQADWSSAFAINEEACEKLGAVHLLQNGIWAFKTNAKGERTDLVFQEPQTISDKVRRIAEGLILTEWKLVQEQDIPETKLSEARHQAERYSEGILGGIELASVRYLVMVSKRRLTLEPESVATHGTYRHINIVVEPDTPSVESRKLSRNRRPKSD